MVKYSREPTNKNTSAKAKGSVTATDRKAMAAAVAGAAPAYYVCPSPTGWVVAPLIVAKQRRRV